MVWIRQASQPLRDNNVGLDEWFEQNNQLRFLLPIRHPIDCALANQGTGHAKHLGLAEDEAWKQAVLEVFDSDRRYQHEQNLVRSYKEIVQNKFAL